MPKLGSLVWGPLPYVKHLNPFSHPGGVPCQRGWSLNEKQENFMIAQKRVEGIFLVWAILAPWALLEPYLTKSAQPCFPIILYCVFSPKNCKKKEIKEQQVSLEPHTKQKKAC